MKSVSNNLFNLYLTKLINKVKNKYYQIGNDKKCYICNNNLRQFTKFHGGSKNISDWIRNIDLVGSDVDNFGCPHCFCNDRERHLFMFFDKLNLWEKISTSHILHFAPEQHLSKKIQKISPVKYVKADLMPYEKTTEKIDATDIPYNDDYFDFVFFNHILEHIPNYKMALKEIFRVLKPNGIAILQTPYSKLLKANFEDVAINTGQLRQFFYCQDDHVRIFSEYEFINTFKEIGFNVEVIRHSDFFSDNDAYYYGVNKNEDLIKVRKPG